MIRKAAMFDPGTATLSRRAQRRRQAAPRQPTPAGYAASNGVSHERSARVGQPPADRVRVAAATSARRDGGEAERASLCRVWEHLLDGYQTFPADQQVASHLVTMLPGAARMAKAGRGFTSRAVRAVAAMGVDQILDLGCGLLSSVDSVHDTILQVAPQARTVHVDIDLFATAHAADVIAASGRQHLATAFRADLRDPQSVLTDRRIARRLDLTRPVAVVATGLLEYLADEQADQLLTGIRHTVADGSYLIVTHPTSELHAEVQNLTAVTGARPRTRHHLRGLLAGWQLNPPGLVWASRWHPRDAGTPAGAAPASSSAAEPGDRYLLAALAHMAATNTSR
jgi:hypothetical protein